MLSGQGFQTQELSTHLFPPSLHPCPQVKWVDTHSRIHWEECRGSLDQVLFSNSLGTVVDWGHYGIAIHVCSRVKCSEPQSLRDQMSELNFPKIIKSPYNISIFWKGKVLAPP